MNLDRPMAGRGHESESILHQLDIAASGITRVGMLAGEPGIGKTRLLDWAAEQAASRGATVLRGGAFHAEGMPPYLPLLEAHWHWLHCSGVRLYQQEQLHEPQRVEHATRN